MSSDSLSTLVDSAEAAILAVDSSARLADVEVAYLGTKGLIQAQLKSIGTLPKEDRPSFGERVNSARNRLADQIALRKAELACSELDNKLAAEVVDITLPGRPFGTGGTHPLTQTTQRVKTALIGLGFEIVDGPELEMYRYNFAALNYPEDHPAFDEMMTFYIDDTHLLRTQTTALQGRMLPDRKPPLRLATLGRCFRYEAVDATHHHTFHQVDAFMVDSGVSMADLKGTLKQFAGEMFGADVQVRFRPDYFPFVEPGVDYSIQFEGRWLELGGAGLIHPNILRANGFDTERYSGFAFGLGLERTHMIRNGVTDLRSYLENDLRFLRQFKS